jgi:hypothetical protein
MIFAGLFAQQLLQLSLILQQETHGLMCNPPRERLAVQMHRATA